MDQIVLDPEPKTSGFWSRWLKFEFQLISPGKNAP